MIIMPSMPILTMPTRSAHRPASPANKIGVATRIVDEIVPELVMSLAFVMSRTTDKTIMKPSDKNIVRRATERVCKNFIPQPPELPKPRLPCVECVCHPNVSRLH